MKTAKKLIIVLLIISVFIPSLFTLQGCQVQKNKGFYKASKHKDGYATLYIPDGEDFKILLLSDPQIDSTEKYKNVGSMGIDKTYQFVKDMARAANPDLVIINGDLFMQDDYSSSTPYYKRYAEIFEELKIPWSFTFGNHDLDEKYIDWEADAEDESSQCSKQVLIDFLSTKYKYCLIGSDTLSSGAGNHTINIRDSKGNLIYSLFLFDCEYNQSTLFYNPIPTGEQVDWYKKTISNLSDKEYGNDRGDKVIKSMIFNHVGIPEFYTAWQLAWNNGNPTEDYFYGHLLEGDYTGKYGDTLEENQIFSVAYNLKSTTAIFMAHHHNNDMSVNYKGIRLTFGQHSGYSHYYRTTQTFKGSILPDYTQLKNWENISFELVDNYGDQRGGTEITISTDTSFDIQPLYARNLLDNYKEEYYIDYDALAYFLDNNEDYQGTVARGEYRKWKIE